MMAILISNIVVNIALSAIPIDDLIYMIKLLKIMLSIQKK